MRWHHCCVTNIREIFPKYHLILSDKNSSNLHLSTNLTKHNDYICSIDKCMSLTFSLLSLVAATFLFSRFWCNTINENLQTEKCTGKVCFLVLLTLMFINFTKVQQATIQCSCNHFWPHSHFHKLPSIPFIGKKERRDFYPDLDFNQCSRFSSVLLLDWRWRWR